MAVTILCVLSNNIKTPLHPLLSPTARFGPSWLTCHKRSFRSSPSVEAAGLSLIFLSQQHWVVYIIWALETGFETEWMPQAHRGCGRLSDTLDFQNQLWQSPRSCVGGRCKKVKKTVKDSVAHYEVSAVLCAHDPPPITLGIRKRLPSWAFHLSDGLQN